MNIIRMAARLGIFAVAAVLVAGSAFAADWLVDSPSDGVELSTITEGSFSMLVAECGGKLLPGEDSIVASMPAPASGRAHASSIVPYDRHWAVPSWPRSAAKIPRLTQYAIWERPSGGYIAMVSATGGGMLTYLSGEGGRITVRAHSYMDGFSPDRVPLVAWGSGDDPYELTESLYAFALRAMREVDPDGVIGRLRSEKAYPEVFEYLGWCSWNAHYTDISGDALIAHAKRFDELGVPVRWMIIDDGWETLTEADTKAKKKRGMSLSSFEAHKEKFPEGLAPVVEEVKSYGITWMGAWNTFNGYWNGVAIDSELGEMYGDALMPVTAGAAIPDVRDDSGAAFWDAYYSALIEDGIDFVKTDNQSTMYDFTEGMVPVGDAYANGQRNFQKVAEEKFDSTVINCMSMGVDTIYQWETTNIARVSRDFYPLPWHNPRAHTVECVMNSMWFSRLAYPDYDMWQTHDQHREYHAVARAISGGPVYITDKLGEERPEHVLPLVLSDGRVLRADGPGLPARQSLFVDPYVALKPLVAFARSGKGGLLGVWNVNRLELPVKGSVSPADVEGMEGDRFAMYEYFDNKLLEVGREEAHEFTMCGWDTRIFSVMPIKDGFAPVGLSNKYGPVMAVKSWSVDADSAEVVLSEGGPFLAWSEKRPESIKANGKEVDARRISYADSALRVDLSPGTAEEVVVKIEWY